MCVWVCAKAPRREALVCGMHIRLSGHMLSSKLSSDFTMASETTRDDPCKQLEGQIGCVLHVGVF